MEDQKQDVIQREVPEDIAPERTARVKLWQKRVQAAKEHYKKTFEQMRKDMKYARLGYDPDEWDDSQYYANITQRHINQAVATLYAKNPTAIAKRKPRLDFKVWDGNERTLMEAVQRVAMAQANQLPVMQGDMELLQDVQEGQLHRRMLDRVGKTMEVLFNHYLSEQEPVFKKGMKQVVRRAKVCAVAYVERGFQRVMGPRVEIQTQIADTQSQIDRIEMLGADAADGEITEGDPRLEELRSMLEDLRRQEFAIVREGPILDTTLKSTQVIPDPRCKQLNGFIGCKWIAIEELRTVDEIKEIYKKDVGKNYVQSNPKNVTRFEAILAEAAEKKSDMVLTWRIQDKESGQYFTIADGYGDFLKEPAVPDVATDRFWSLFVLTFNDIEDEDEIFPNSDVHLLKPMQNDYNRARQGLREHRQANRPKYATVKGRLEQSDLDKLASYQAHAILELAALKEGEDVGRLLQAIQGAPIDPAMYDTRSTFEDTLRVVGAQEANLGGTAGGTATESSIAEGSRMTASSSGVDDLDTFLTEIARDMGQVMLMELSPETVMRIVGPGAVWPQVSREEIAEELFLNVQAGSSGRPNKAAELANYERAAPHIAQAPGLNPTWWLKKSLELLFDNDTTLEDAILEGMPSLVALNAAKQPSTGDAMSDPNQQGGQGGANSQQAPQNEPGAQPAYPTPMPVG